MKPYKKRMVKEFNQLKKRRGKLEKILLKDQAHKLEFDLASGRYLLEEQLKAMDKYLEVLKKRAVLENIDVEF